MSAELYTAQPVLPIAEIVSSPVRNAEPMLPYRRTLAAGMAVLHMATGVSGVQSRKNTEQFRPDRVTAIAEVAQIIGSDSVTPRLEELRQTYANAARLQGVLYPKKQLIYSHNHARTQYTKELAEGLGLTIHTPDIDDLLIDTSDSPTMIHNGRRLKREGNANSIPYSVYISRAREFAAQYGITIADNVEQATGDGTPNTITKADLESIDTKRTLVNMMQFLEQQPASLPQKIGWHRIEFVRGKGYVAAAPPGAMLLNLDSKDVLDKPVYAHEEGHLIDWAIVPNGNVYDDPAFAALNAGMTYDVDSRPHDTDLEYYGGGASPTNDYVTPSASQDAKDITFVTHARNVAEDKADMTIPLLSPTGDGLESVTNDRELRLQNKAVQLYGRIAEHMPAEVAYMLLTHDERWQKTAVNNPLLTTSIGVDWRTLPEVPIMQLAETSCQPRQDVIADVRAKVVPQ